MRYFIAILAFVFTMGIGAPAQAEDSVRDTNPISNTGDRYQAGKTETVQNTNPIPGSNRSRFRKTTTVRVIRSNPIPVSYWSHTSR